VNKEISKFGITFKRLNSDTIELIRQWRNSDDVRLYMQYQKIISREEQESWFKRIDNEENYYFISFYNNEAYGLYNVKDIDYSKKVGEIGVFLKDRSFWEGDISMRGSYFLITYCFDILLLEQVTAHVLKNNTKVLQYNKQLGFKIDETYQSDQSYFLVMKKDDFYTSKNKKLLEYLETYN
jgi:UDP-4-amino-4,6-dideoxy-N-acetyl-beta-L-altrosamine N-acetyltransferase